MPKTRPQPAPPAVVIFGDEEFRKSKALEQTVSALLPPDVDRGLALCEYDGSRPDHQGGAALATVMDDLATLPFLTDRRVVVIRDADKFITAHRAPLERYMQSPSPTGTLILICRSFPRTTRLYKAIATCGGQLLECKKLKGRGLIDFVIAEVAARRKRVDFSVAARLVELIGQEEGILAAEVEKLCLYTAERSTITADDVSDLVGLTREEKIFAAMDAAGLGRSAEAVQLWHDVLATDPSAAFKAVGGMTYVLRRWLSAHRMLADGLPLPTIAAKVMWGRGRELQTLLQRLPAVRIKRILATIAQLDSQAKVGARSIETGIEALLLQVAAPAA